MTSSCPLKHPLLVVSLATLSLTARPRRAAAEDASATASATETAAAATTEPAPRYPRAVIARPLTLPRQLAMLGADATANHDVGTMGAAPVLGYGITDELEVQLSYACATRPFELDGSMNVDVGYALLRGAAGGKLEAVARVRGGYSLVEEAATPLLIGVHVQYNVTDTLAIVSGVPGSQQLRISLAKDAAMQTPIDISLPIGVGYQATGQLYFQLDTKLVQLDLGDSANVVIGADATPVTLTAIYNVLPALDVQAAIGSDLSNAPDDSLTFLIGARYYAGKAGKAEKQ